MVVSIATKTFEILQLLLYFWSNEHYLVFPTVNFFQTLQEYLCDTIECFIKFQGKFQVQFFRY